jgi:hypothetical protein
MGFHQFAPLYPHQKPDALSTSNWQTAEGDLKLGLLLPFHEKYRCDIIHETIDNSRNELFVLNPPPLL